jgi:hypothetical protein
MLLLRAAHRSHTQKLAAGNLGESGFWSLKMADLSPR